MVNVCVSAWAAVVSIQVGRRVRVRVCVEAIRCIGGLGPAREFTSSERDGGLWTHIFLYAFLGGVKNCPALYKGARIRARECGDTR